MLAIPFGLQFGLLYVRLHETGSYLHGALAGALIVAATGVVLHRRPDPTDDLEYEGTQRELGFVGSYERRYSFHVDLFPGGQRFIFAHDQGRNHWESHASVATLPEVRAEWPRFISHLLECNCGWAIPIFEEGFQSMDVVATASKLVDYSHRLRDLQFER